jgi:hypothetical protein
MHHKLCALEMARRDEDLVYFGDSQAAIKVVLLAARVGFDFVFVYWHLILVNPVGPRFQSTFLPRLTLAMVVLFCF